MEGLTPRSPATIARPQRVLVLLFLALLAAPAIDMCLRPARARGPETEGRAAKPFPNLRVALRERSNYPRNFEQAFADALGLRDFLLRWHNWTRFELLHVAPAPVLLGKDRWMFYTSDHSLENWRGLYRLKQEQLEHWQQVLESRRDCARAHGADYFCVIGPNKESIYPDYLPEGYEPLGPTRLDQLTEWMAAHSDVTLVDLRPCLRAARSGDTPQHFLYYEEGSHWHGRGCLTASREILRRVGEHFPAVASLPEPAWQLLSFPEAESWRPKMYMSVPPTRLRDEPFLPEEARRAQHLGTDYTAKEQRYRQRAPAPGLPSVVMFHDSFGGGVEKLLAEGFASLTTVSGPAFDEELISSERPTIVIDLFVERVLTYSLPMAPRK